MGLKGNLTCGEILEQLVHANSIKRIRNIVFMGMGEPMNNYEQVRAGAPAGLGCKAWRAWCPLLRPAPGAVHAGGRLAGARPGASPPPVLPRRSSRLCR